MVFNKSGNGFLGEVEEIMMEEDGKFLFLCFVDV